MDNARKKQLFLIGGAALAVLVLAVVLIVALGGRGGRQYQRYYEAAEGAYLRRDYPEALAQLDKAMDLKTTEECYLLLANVYYAQGDPDRAMQVLYLGYSRVGGEAIARLLEDLKTEQSGIVDLPDDGGVYVKGERLERDAVSAVLSNRGLRDGDIAELSGLTELESLSLSGNQLTDLGPLSGLTKLTSLQLSNNAVSDLAPLAGLSHLKTLYLDGNPLGDLSPLYDLEALRTLSVKNVRLTQRQLAALKEALPACSIFSDVAAEDGGAELTLGGRSFTTEATELDLSGLGLEDVSVLSRCKKLTRLDLGGNRISDLSPLVELGELEWLNLRDNRAEDLTPLMSLSALRYLNAAGNRVADVTSVEYLQNLEELRLDGNPLKSVRPLSRLTALEKLGLRATGLTDRELERLAGLTGLTELDIQENEGLSADVFDALQAALPGCAIAHGDLVYTVSLAGRDYRTDAEELDLSGAGLTELAGLERFHKLKRLDLSGNDLADLTPLAELEGLEALDVTENPRLTEEAVEALREALPGCEVTADDFSRKGWRSAYRVFLEEGEYLQYGDGYFTESSYYPISAALRDLDADGTPELVVTNGSDVEAGAQSYVFAWRDDAVTYLGVAGFRIGLFLLPADPAYPGLFWQNGNMGYFPGYYYFVRDGRLYSEQVLLAEIPAGETEPVVTQVTADNALFAACRDATETLGMYAVSNLESIGWDVFLGNQGYGE